MGDTELASQETIALWGDIDIARIALGAWKAAAEARAVRHRPGGYCPTRYAPYGPRDPRGELVQEACSSSGCLGIFHDLLIRVVHKVHRHDELHPGQPIDNLPGFAAQVARSEMVELQRAKRASSGLPAKPTRNDGAAGRVNSVLARDPHTGEWFVTLFRIMRAYPFSQHHVCGSWPIDGLVEERAKFLLGGDARQVRREIDLVMAAATAQAGRTWVFDNLVTPLMSHGDHTELTPDQPDPKEIRYEDAALATLLREAYWRHRGLGYSSRAALRAASRKVCGISAPVNAETEEFLNELEAQPPAVLVRGLHSLSR